MIYKSITDNHTMDKCDSICELYCKLALGSVVRELREELGKQSRIIVANAAKKRLGELMFSHLKTEMSSYEGQNKIVSLCEMIQSMEGPKITCDQDGDEMTFRIHECHLIESAKIEPYICEITQGWIEFMIEKTFDESYIVKRDSTILEGNETCVFTCKRNLESAQTSISALKRIEELQSRISDSVVIIIEFTQIDEFNKFSIEINNNQNAEIKNVNMVEGKCLVQVNVGREGLTRIR